MPAANATATDPRTLAREAVRGVTSIATLPDVTVRIVQMVENPRSSAAGLHQIVSHDPALVTRILKVVNSSFYGLSGQVTLIERAIVLLGLNAVKNTAVAASMGQMFRGAKLCEGFTAKDLWAHCVAVAVSAREIARQINPAIAEEAFLAGMIHDVGVLVELQLWPEKFRAACEGARTATRSFTEVESEMMHLTHQDLGLALTEQWRFPKTCQLVAGFHHDVTQMDAAEASHRQIVSIVYAADVICCRSKHGFNLTAKDQELGIPAAGDLIDEKVVNDVIEKLDSLVAASSSLLGS